MSQVFFSTDPDSDPEMRQANEQARETIRFFFRELVWEGRRIVPGLDLACVKAPFRDPPQGKADTPTVEQMWVGDVHFDGKFVRGTLMNSPNWLTSVEEGDDIALPIQGVSDWMYAISGRVYGAFTVNLMRRRMAPAERAEHDEAWGLDFGDPNQVQVLPLDWETPSGKKVATFGSAPMAPIDPDGDHPMAINMIGKLQEHLQAHPTSATEGDERGWTHLHDMAVAGADRAISVLLQHGAKASARSRDGVTPLDIARTLGWKKATKLLGG